MPGSLPPSLRASLICPRWWSIYCLRWWFFHTLTLFRAVSQLCSLTPITTGINNIIKLQPKYLHLPFGFMTRRKKMYSPSVLLFRGGAYKHTSSFQRYHLTQIIYFPIARSVPEELDAFTRESSKLWATSLNKRPFICLSRWGSENYFGFTNIKPDKI